MYQNFEYINIKRAYNNIIHTADGVVGRVTDC